MKVLVTAGSTMTMIDKVRGLTNIFRGTTGRKIAHYFGEQGCDVDLITSEKGPACVFLRQVSHFKTYDQLYDLMKSQITKNNYDIIIHSAAVSDYKPDGTFVMDDCFEDKNTLVKIDDSKKVDSEYKELFIRLVPTRKIIDDIRTLWNFTGILVKFKLQVGITDNELLGIARASREHSKADLIVANCLEWSGDKAYVIDSNDKATKVNRDILASTLYEMLTKEV